MKNNNGITLVALIITIIVLLIIATVSITFLTGENGILNKAQSAKEEQSKAEAEEQLKLKLSDYLTNNLGTSDLSSIDGMTIDGYQVGLTGIGRIVSMTKDGQIYNFLVDDKYNVISLNGTTFTSNPVVSTGANQKYETVYVKNAVQGKMTLYINPISDITINNVKFYLDDNVVYSGTDLTYTATNLQIGKEYNVYAIVEFANDKKITTATSSQLPVADIYVTIDGNDTIGNGTIDNPYASVKKAIDVASSGEKIYIAPGRYTLQPITDDSTSADGIYDEGKQLEIFGQNELTILTFDGTSTNLRDGNAVALHNANSILRNLTYEFKPKSAANYSKAIFRWTLGKTKNVFFRITGSYAASYLYFNSGGTGSLTQNCTFFHDLGSVDVNYTGTMNFTNIATNVSTQGTNTNVIVNTFGNSSMTTKQLIDASQQAQTFINNQVGVFYGVNAW